MHILPGNGAYIPRCKHTDVCDAYYGGRVMVFIEFLAAFSGGYAFGVLMASVFCRTKWTR